MQDIFDKVTKSIKDISQNVVEQTKTTVNQGKVELELIQTKNELKKLYTRLGEKVYQNRLYPQADPGIEALYDMIATKIKKISELEVSIDNIREEQKNTMESLKRNVKKTWNSENEEEKAPETDEEGYIHMKFCSHCNIGNHPDAQYCIACGYTMESEESKEEPEEE